MYTVYDSSSPSMTDMTDWCEENFGERDGHGYGRWTMTWDPKHSADQYTMMYKWFFRYEADAVLFALRWDIA
jgi:hypothetical protein